MKNNIVKFLILVFLAVGLPLKANAEILTTSYLKTEIKKDLLNQLEEKFAGEIKIRVKNLPYQTIKVPEGKIVVKTAPNLKYFSPNMVLRVAVYSNDQYVKSFGVPVAVRILDRVLVAKESINIGQTLTLSNVAVEKRDISLKANTVLDSNFNWSNMITKKRFQAGDIIDKRFVESIPKVLKNSPVSVIFKSNNLNISIDAEAMENGRIGDFIKVRSKKYRKNYRARVISSNKVLVNI